MFDSQNNNRGGYNAGDMDDTNGFNAYGWTGNNANPSKMYDYNDDNPGNVQYEEPFLAGSVLRHTHTAQHGCGNDKNRCTMIMGWACDTRNVAQSDFTGNQNNKPDDARNGMRFQARNGLNTGTSNDPGNIRNIANTYNTNVNNNRGINESEEFYAYCQQRERNKGLFTADQKLQGNTQKYTRQNPGGTRRGLECPEERDYFPWWYPTPWKQAVIWTYNVTKCEEDVQKSQFYEAKGHCHPYPNQLNSETNNKLNSIVNQRNKEDCEADDGRWEELQWQTRTNPNSNTGVRPPLCKLAEWSQVNNLGNVENSEEGGLPRYHDWELPTINELESAGCHMYTYAGQKYSRVVVRLRYNMSTTDYNPYTIDANCNQDNNARIQSPVRQNPSVDVGVDMQGLRLALNTAQTGRVFQDRSHVMTIMEPPAQLTNKKVHNVNVQGKRGNIVQTFPAVEYDFWPRTLNMKPNECISFAWTGSNTHNNGNPAGDGQAGDAGEGTGGTDRSNLIQLLRKDESYPVPLDKNENDFFKTADCYWTLNGGGVSSTGTADELNAQLYLLSGGYYKEWSELEDKEALDVLLNNVSATMRPITCCPKTTGNYVFVSTRNNNFSNRDQKFVVNVANQGQ